jgi:hypothetical protein
VLTAGVIWQVVANSVLIGLPAITRYRDDATEVSDDSTAETVPGYTTSVT